MSSLEIKRQDAQASKVRVTDNTLTVDLNDGRTIAVPLEWYPRLSHATKKERQSWKLIAGGRGIHWPEIDEDISVINLLVGQPSAESQTSFKKWLGNRSRPPRAKD